MTQVVVVAVLVAVVAGVAYVLQRRRPAPAPIRTGGQAPDRLERSDFARPEAPWLVVAFSSSTCLACRGTWEKVAVLESADVAVHEVAFPQDRALHERYAIDAVPLVLVADAGGLVRATFVGPPSAADLWASLAELREPGTVPPGCDHHGSTASG